MKMTGLIGGMSWESTIEYYKILNRAINRKLADFHSADCLLYSFNFAAISKTGKLFCSMPIFDTAALHAKAAVTLTCSDNE